MRRSLVVAMLLSSSLARTAAAQGFDAAPPPSASTEPEAKLAPPPEPGPPSSAPHDARFGDADQWVISGWSTLDVLFGSESNSQAFDRTLLLDLGVDHFVVARWSFGGYARAGWSDVRGYGRSSIDETTTTQFGMGARIGYDAPLGATFSLWTRAGIDVSERRVVFESSQQPGTHVGDTRLEHPLGVQASSLLLAHLAAHLFVGFGPRAYYDLASRTSGEVRRFAWGASLIVGGWF